MLRIKGIFQPTVGLTVCHDLLHIYKMEDTYVNVSRRCGEWKDKDLFR